MQHFINQHQNSTLKFLRLLRWNKHSLLLKILHKIRFTIYSFKHFLDFKIISKATFFNSILHQNDHSPEVVSKYFNVYCFLQVSWQKYWRVINFKNLLGLRLEINGEILTGYSFEGWTMKKETRRKEAKWIIIMFNPKNQH